MNNQHTPPSPDSLLTTLRSFPRPVWVLFAGVFLNKFGTFVLPFLAIYLTRRGFTNADAGIALGCYGLGRIAAAFIGGHLADRIGRRNTVLLSMTLTAVSMVLLSQAETLPAIAALTALASLTGEMYVPACTALLTDLTPPAQRLTVFSAYRMAFNAGWAFGPAAAAFIAAHSFTWLFIGDAITSLLFAVIAWFWLPRTGNGMKEAGWTEAAVTLKQDKRFLRVALSTLFIGMCIHQMISTYGLHVTALGFSDATYGMLLSFNGLLVLFCDLPLTRLTTRFPAPVMMALGYLLIGLGLTSNLVLHTLPGLFVGIVLFTVGEMIFAPVASAHVSKLAPANMRGRYMGGWAMSNSLAMFLAPNLGMKFYDRNPTMLWLFCGGCAVVAAITIFTSPRQMEPDVVKVEPAVG
jgi:MFS family permease